MSEINISHLIVDYKTKNKKNIVRAIDDVSLCFKDGSFNVILGCSGCGKTTLLKTILGLVPYEGDIALDDVDILNYQISERNFAYVSQDIVLQPQATIFDNIAYPLKIRGMERKDIIEKVYEISEELGIKECLSRKPKHISIGQAQRVAIARALVKNAVAYFFDEPFSNLDEVNRNEGRHLIREFVKSRNATVVYVTHSIKEATALADNIIVMDEGKIIFTGSPEQLLLSDEIAVKALVEADNERTI